MRRLGFWPPLLAAFAVTVACLMPPGTYRSAAALVAVAGPAPMLG